MTGRHIRPLIEIYFAYLLDASLPLALSLYPFPYPQATGLHYQTARPSLPTSLPPYSNAKQ